MHVVAGGYSIKLPATPTLTDHLPPPGKGMLLQVAMIVAHHPLLLLTLSAVPLTIHLQKKKTVTCIKFSSINRADLPGLQHFGENDRAKMLLGQDLQGMPLPSLDNILDQHYTSSSCICHQTTPTSLQTFHVPAWSFRALCSLARS